MHMKICRKCKENKELGFFNKNKNSKDGLQSMCITCVAIQNYNYYRKNRKERVRYHKEYAQTLVGKEKGKRGRLKYLKTEKGKTAQDKYMTSPKGKARRAQAHKRHRQTPKGKAKHASIAAKYRAVKLQRTPKWLTPEDYKKIQVFYDEAARLTEETGTEYHVDHIIPLQGENVSGLHVPENLQVLIGPGPDGNCSKSNKFDL